MTAMDKGVLERAIRYKELSVLRAYMEATDVDDRCTITDLDAEARIAFYQAQYQQTSVAHYDPTAAVLSYESSAADARFETRSLPSGGRGETVRRLPPHQFLVGPTSSGLSPALSSKMLNTNTTLIAAAPSLRQVHSLLMMEEQQPGDEGVAVDGDAVMDSLSEEHHTIHRDTTHAQGHHQQRSRDLPLMLHRKLNRRLFRSYASYLPAAVTTDHRLHWSGHADQQRVVERYKASWDAAAAPLGEELSVVPAPSADTSTFLIQRVAELTWSPKSVSLHRKNAELHEDEARVDIVQLEAYEWNILAQMASEHLQRCVGVHQGRQRVVVETDEARERLGISTQQLEIWHSFLNVVNLWRQGPAKEQNMLLVNEIVLRRRIQQEELESRRIVVTVQRHEAEHQLAEWRRLVSLEKEHRRAAVMHRHLMLALSMQGVEGDTPAPGGDPYRSAMSPARAASIAYPSVLPPHKSLVYQHNTHSSLERATFAGVPVGELHRLARASQQHQNPDSLRYGVGLPPASLQSQPECHMQ